MKESEIKQNKTKESMRIKENKTGKEKIRDKQNKMKSGIIKKK